MTTPVVVIGCGLIGQKRVHALPGEFEVVAVHDSDADRAAALATAVGAHALKSADEALSVAGAGLAIVATTHDALVSEAARALDAGFDVLVEKPGGRNRAEVAVLREQAIAKDRVVRVGFNHRFHPGLAMASDLVRSGDHGDVMHVRARYGHGGRKGYEREWRAEPARSGGGELLDQGVHLLDLVRFVTGSEIELVYASLDTLFWHMGVEDNSFLHLRVGERGHAWLHASWTEWKNLFSFEVACERAKVEVTGLGGSYGPERLSLYEMDAEMVPPLLQAWEWPADDVSWRHEMQDVADALVGRPARGADLDECLAVLSIVEEAYSR